MVFAKYIFAKNEVREFSKARSDVQNLFVCKLFVLNNSLFTFNRHYFLTSLLTGPVTMKT